MNNFTHSDFKEMKKALKLKNKDIAVIVGLKVNTVKDMTAPSKHLPTWAKSMIYVWKLKP